MDKEGIMAEQGKLTWIATAAFGLEGVVADELHSLGCFNAKAELGGARFEATPGEAYSACLWLRCADRVLLVLSEAKVLTFEELFQAVKVIPWEDFLLIDSAFPVSGKCARSQLMSVRDCQAITKKAIVERMKAHYKSNWFAETGAVYPIDVSIHSDVARLTLDLSGTALNRRGYRTWNGEAPLRETLAAAIIRLSPWKPGMPLHDPCCGTGTLLIEAAMMQSRRAPGLNRTFACDQWDFFPAVERANLREKAQAAYDPIKIEEITGSDIDPNTLDLCRKHITQAGMEGRIRVFPKDLRTLKLQERDGVFLANPPYGERLGNKKSAESLYGEMRLLLDRHEGWRMGVLSSHPGFERHFGRKAQKKRRLYNGRLECEFFIY
jgi:putative N6-adenine-specific DNA methylase